ncbi:fibrous sheath CABYR-binding protein-like [Patagioenas fasciata monilis]|uniref:Fibrous sheath CABYR-binding protein-like n=1 Tax=Patagioenas fasciata monilis TaxID=372326 RepID=A0A1V4K566_PATFA|nr:fibrous sheath CABYR-binding protein-like [Patagioenas fasciata monilis]
MFSVLPASCTHQSGQLEIIRGTATAKRKLVLELIHTVRAFQAVTERRHEQLRAELARWHGAVGSRSGTPPGDPSIPTARVNEQVQLGLPGARDHSEHLGEELPWVDVDMDDAVDGDEDKDKDAGPDRSSSVELERRSPMESGRSNPVVPSRRSLVEEKRSSPVEPQRSHNTGPGRSSSMEMDSHISVGLKWSSPVARGRSSPAEPRPRWWVPTAGTRGRVAPGLRRAARFLRDGCARLWGWLRGWWRRRCRRPRVFFCQPPWWQHWSQKSNGFHYY